LPSKIVNRPKQAFPGKVTYEKSEYTFENDLSEKIKDIILDLEPGEYYDELIDTGGSFVFRC